MKKIIKNTLVLTVITLVAGILLGFVYEITKEPIAKSKEKAKNEAYRSVMAEADTFEAYADFDSEEASKVIADAGIPGCHVDEAVVAKKGEEVKGYVITTTSGEGYGGDIQISIGIAEDGTVEGIAILSIGETAGLGMRATEPEFQAQFVGKKVDTFTVTKTGAQAENEIDALSGATITSNAVTNAVNAGVAYFHHEIGGGVNE